MNPHQFPIATLLRCLALAGGMATQVTAHAVPAQAPAAAAACFACHGTNGEGNAAGVPRLAGQNSHYLEHALSTFRAGTRSSPVMQPVALALNDAEVQALSSYFGSLQRVRAAPTPPVSDALLQAGQELAQVGAITNPTPPCLSCHATSAGGANPRFPSLAGQPAAYVVNRLHQFQARARAAPPEPASMTAVATQLDETQIRQVAAYLATLPPP